MIKFHLLLKIINSTIVRFTIAVFVLISDFLFSQLTLQNAFPNLSFSNPLFLTSADDNTNRIFVVEQGGRIKVFPNSQTASTAKEFLDITDRVISGGETGLLGLAFHPDYENNGYFYVHYTAGNPLRTIISRFQVTSNPDSANKNSEFQILVFNQPFGNHKGGWLGFGPNDNYLYIATGDGGSDNNGQSTTTNLGKILRIDVDAGTPYVIPPNNPFFDSTGTVKREIYAWGFRNPWRCSFDSVTGWLYSGDVGQNNWEEINIIENGKNYGWRCYEGNHIYNILGCNYPIYTFPIWEYPHSLECSITGGYVYRGVNVPELTGKYIYGDYCSGKIWALEYDSINPPVNEYLLSVPGNLTSFGLDNQLELYITSFDGNIYKFTPNPAPVELYSFVASVENFKIVLNWETRTEVNNYGFEVERSMDNDWIKLEFIEGNGNSNSPKYYTYIDNDVVNGQKYFYRLKQLDTDGSFKYSHVVEIKIEKQMIFELEQNYPNPFNPLTKLRYTIPQPSNVAINIFDQLGNNIESFEFGQKETGSYEFTWFPENLPSGVYFYQIKAGNFFQTKKMVLIR